MSFWKSLVKKNRYDIDNVEQDIVDLGVTDSNIFDRLNEYGNMDYYNTIYTYDGNDNLTTIVWKDDENVTIRTDTFTYVTTAENETIIQNIAITGGGSYTISTLFDLDGNVLSVDRTVL